MSSRTRIIDALACTDYGKEITVKGWVRSHRSSKAVDFIALNDGSTIKNIQIVVDPAKVDADMLKSITTGACIRATGKLVESQGSGQTVEIQNPDIEVYGLCPSDYPMQKKGQSFEYMRQYAHMRLRTNTFGAVFRIRHNMAIAIHKYFHEHGFYYFNTPLITASDAEGAGEMFQVTTLDLDRVAKSGKVEYDKDFFGKKTNLTVSGQLEGELGATALGAIYTFGPTFRAENSNTTRHLAEFWMCEPEMAFFDLEDNMDIQEDFIKYLLNWALTKCSADMEFFNKRIQPGVIDTLRHVVETPFKRVSYTEAIAELEKHAEDFEYKPYWGCDLATEHERYLTEKIYKCPVMVYNYPKEIKAFYMKANDDGKTVKAVDVLVPGLGEIIGGSEREEDYDKLLNRIKELGLKPEDYSWYLDLRKFGTVPHSGFGLGFERAIMYLTGMENIRDVLPFPRTVGNCRISATLFRSHALQNSQISNFVISDEKTGSHHCNFCTERFSQP